MISKIEENAEWERFMWNNWTYKFWEENYWGERDEFKILSSQISIVSINFLCVLGVSDPKIKYKGNCLDSSGAHSSGNIFKIVSVEGYSECYENCKSAQNCAAFGFKPLKPRGTVWYL